MQIKTGIEFNRNKLGWKDPVLYSYIWITTRNICTDFFATI